MNDYEYQAAQLAEQRRHMLAQQMQAQEAPQGRMVSGHYVKSHPLEFLAQGLRQYMAGSKLEKNSQAREELGKKKSTALSEALRTFGNFAQGTPAKPETADDIVPGMPAQAAQAPNMQAANQSLMNSGFADLQKMGMQNIMADTQARAAQAQKQAEQQRVIGILSRAKSPQEALQSGAPYDMVKNYFEAPRLGQEKLSFVNGQGVGEYSGKPVGNVIPKQAAAPNMATDLLIPNEKGGYSPNMPLVDIKRLLAKSGASNVNVTQRVENKAAENMASQVGGILEKSATGAEGAGRVNDAANRVIQSVDSGKIIAGPLAGGRLTLAQGAQMLGVGGKDQAEVIANTRQAIRGLAEMTLQGRKQMSGQGAITESESKLAEKANSGDISDLTPAEVKQLAQASKRASEWTIRAHSKKIDAARRLPGAEGIVPFYENADAPALPSSGMPSGFRVVR